MGCRRGETAPSRKEETMKRTARFVWLAFILLLLAPSAFAAEVLTNESILTMVKAGLGEDLVISKIKISQGQYDISTSGLLRLKAEGVSDTVIKAMIERSAKAGSPSAMPVQTAAPPPTGAREAQEQAIALYGQGKAAEAVSAFDALIAEQPNDDGLKIWKAKALLEQARQMRESKVPNYKPLIINAWAILKSVAQRQQGDPDWNFAVGKALWLNDRPDRGRRSAEKATALRPSFAEAHLLLGDIAYEECVVPPAGRPQGDNARWLGAMEARKAYEAAMAIVDLPPGLRAEALYKLGMVSAELENKKAAARELWERAVAADPTSRYGRMAAEKLKAVSAK
jgi:tetratricopeptide (TPR) repeat protein